ncbi:MAG: hypothetical protein ACLQVD_14770 [Capsulimonadaceae bacterium]
MEVRRPRETATGQLTLEEQFRAEIEADIETQKREFNYVPIYFKRMIAEHGTVNACKKLLAAPEVQQGFTRLVEWDRLDLSMEHQVHKPKYNVLFTGEERSIARRRLKKVGYDPRRYAG